MPAQVRDGLRSSVPSRTSRAHLMKPRPTRLEASAMKLLLWCSLALATVCFSRPAFAVEDAAALRLAEMNGLVGTWRQADKPGSPLRIRFSLTAGGTAVVEEWLRGSQPHSLTIYHRDGQGLIATHYCPQGNQPRLAWVPSSAVNVLRFNFRDATDLDATHESYLVALAFDLSHEGKIVRTETYRQAGEDEVSTMHLVRDQH